MLNRMKGFTLIELLVVIAIIAILAAILFPIFVNVKTAAKRSVDLTYQRQMAMGLSMYADSNNGRFPWPSMIGTLRYFPTYPSGTNTTISGELIFLLMPYVRDKHVFYCPAVDEYNKAYSYQTQSQASPPFMFIGFYYYGTADWGNPNEPIKQAGSPRRILVSCIGGGVTTNAGGTGEGISGHGKAQGIYTFADCHCKFIRHFNYPYSYSECVAMKDMNKLLLPKWPGQ